MTKHEYMLLFGMIGLLGIDGIDVYIADVLQRAGVLTPEMLQQLSIEEIINGGNVKVGRKDYPVKGVKAVESEMSDVLEPLTMEKIEIFKDNLYKLLKGGLKEGRI
ncbi:MAG: hypothetical protein ACTSU2_02475 [Promethearchaeota archaeon]